MTGKPNGLLDLDKLAAIKRRIERVEIPELGQHVFVREMSAGERDEWEDAVSDERGMIQSIGFTSKTLARTLCDGEGNLRYTTAEDLEKLAAAGASVMQRLYRVAKAINGIGAETAQAEEAEKN